MTRVWELGRCASDGAGERNGLGLGCCGWALFWTGWGRGCVLVDKVGAHLCGFLPWVFGLGGLGVFGSGDFVHVFSFMNVMVGRLLDLRPNIFEHG